MVVLHLGCIEMKEYTDKLLEMIQRDQRDTPKYSLLCEEVMEKREKKKERNMEYACQMLERIATLAEQHGVKLGIENRQALEEIPLDSDFDLFLMNFNRPCIGYWHDCGHAQIKQHLGFIDHRLHLKAMESRLIGFHIHDVDYPGRDHRQPGTGSVDFGALKSMVKPEHIKVFEFSPSLSPEEAAAGVAFIKSAWGEE